MTRRQGLALLVVLLPTLAALSGCGGGDNTNNANTARNVNANTNTNTSVNTNVSNANISATPLSRIDEIKAKMAVGEIAFNPPPEVKLNEAQTVILLLSPKPTAGELEQKLREKGVTGKVERHTLKVGDKMQALISGDGFQITPLTADTLPVSQLDPTEWSWEVRPLRAGTLNLHVILNAMVDLGDGAGEKPYPIETFHKIYVVEVLRVKEVASASPGRVWSWLLPAVLVPAGGVAAWLWLRGRKRRRAAPRWFKDGAGESRIFLSYRREDTAGHAGRLRDSLAEHFGPERVFMDLESIRAGDDFVEVVRKAVDSSGVVVVLIGRQWLSASDKQGNRRLDNSKDFVRLEVETALKRGVKVIPALVEGAEMPGEDSLPEPLVKLARRNAVELSDSRWVFDVKRLIAAIEGALADEPGTPPG